MKFRNIFLVATILLLFSCNFKLAPAYNEDAAKKVTIAFSGNMALYDKAIASSNKSYAAYQVDYDLIEVQINEIVTFNQTRKRGTFLLGMSNDILARFVKYENDHKTAGTLNNSQLTSYKDYMQALWKPLYNAEINLK